MYLEDSKPKWVYSSGLTCLDIYVIFYSSQWSFSVLKKPDKYDNLVLWFSFANLCTHFGKKKLLYSTSELILVDSYLLKTLKKKNKCNNYKHSLVEIKDYKQPRHIQILLDTHDIR